MPRRELNNANKAKIMAGLLGHYNIFAILSQTLAYSSLYIIFAGARVNIRPSYILDLLLSVINVSIQTVDIVNHLPKLKFD